MQHSTMAFKPRMLTNKQSRCWALDRGVGVTDRGLVSRFKIAPNMQGTCTARMVGRRCLSTK